MDATLNVVVKILAFCDEQINSNPRLRAVDWLRDSSGVSVSDPKSEGFRLQAGQTIDVFDGTRDTTIDSTTEFDIELLPIDSGSRYRLSWTGGVDPTLRTGRALTGNGMTIEFTAQTNASIDVNSSASLFTDVVAGDEIFIPGTTTGDEAGPFSVLNEGYWTVLSVTDDENITIARFSGEDFEGVSESVVLTNNAQMRAYSQAGVQIGDSMDISDGFALATRRTYEVLAVTDIFVEFTSTLPLPAQSGITPNAGVVLLLPLPPGLVFYSSTKSFLYIESTQDIAVQVNGDPGYYNRVTPLDSSDPQKPGMYMRRGPTWSLSLVSRSSYPAQITVIYAE